MRVHQADTGVVFAALVCIGQCAITLTGCDDHRGDAPAPSSTASVAPTVSAASQDAEVTVSCVVPAPEVPEDAPPLVADAVTAARERVVELRTGEHIAALARTLHANGLISAALPVWQALAACEDATPALRAQAWRGVAVCCWSNGEDARAGEAITQAASIASADPWPFIAAGEHALQSGDLDAARASIAQALARAPANVTALTARARLALEEGDGAEAAKVLEPLASRSGWHASLFSSARAMQGLAATNPTTEAATRPESEDPFDLALAAARATREAVLSRVDDALDRKQLDEALRLATRAVQLLPDDPLALDRLSRAQAARGDVAGSAQTLLRACAIAPKDFGSRFNAGSALLQLQRFDEAVVQLESACQLAPTHDAAQRLRGLALASARRYADAVAALEPLEKSRRLSDSQSRLVLAVSLTEIGRPKDGEFVAFQVLNGERANERAWLVLAESVRRQGDLARAAATAAKGVEFVPQSQALRAFVQQCSKEAQGG